MELNTTELEQEVIEVYKRIKKLKKKECSFDDSVLIVSKEFNRTIEEIRLMYLFYHMLKFHYVHNSEIVMTRQLTLKELQLLSNSSVESVSMNVSE